MKTPNLKKTWFSDFLTPIKSIRLILSHKRLSMITFLPSILALILPLYFAGDVFDWMVAQFPAWDGWGLAAIVWCYDAFKTVLAFIGAMVFFGIAFIAAGNVLLLPFIDTILDATQRHTSLDKVVQVPALPFSAWRLTKEGIYSVLIGLALIFSLILLLVPVIGTVFSMILSFYGFALLTLGPMFEREGYGFFDRITELRKRPLAYLAYGAGLWLLLYIPFVNIFLIGIAQASAVPFWFRHYVNNDAELEPGKPEGEA